MSLRYLKPVHVAALKRYLSGYKEAERITGVPWVLIAAVHYRESTLGPGTGQGSCMRFDPPSTGRGIAAKYTAAAQRPLLDLESNTTSAFICAAYFLQEKVGRTLKPTSTLNEMLQAAYRYNGTGYGDIQKSPYVFNDPLGGRQMQIRGTDYRGGVRFVVDQPDGNPGVNVLIPEIREALGAEQVSPPKPVRGPVYFPLAEWSKCRAEPGGRFLDPRYPDIRAKMGDPRYEHPGTDYNKGGTGNADAGEPVYAITDGVVLDSGYYTPNMGNTIQIDHPQYEVASEYMHLQERFVKAGDTVEGGQLIGTVGRGAPNASGVYLFTSHLHLEIRTNRTMNVTRWPGTDKAFIQANYADSEQWLAAHNARDVQGDAADLHPELVRIRDALAAWVTKTLPGYRLSTVRTHWNPLNANQAALLKASTTSEQRNPHTLRPALAFDFRLVRGGSVVAPSDAAYAQAGAEAERLGGLWGPHVRGGVLGEPGGLRDHVQLKNAQAAIKEQLDKVRRGVGQVGTVNPDLAAEGSAPAGPVQQRGAPCPGQ